MSFLDKVTLPGEAKRENPQSATGGFLSKVSLPPTDARGQQRQNVFNQEQVARQEAERANSTLGLAKETALGVGRTFTESSRSFGDSLSGLVGSIFKGKAGKSLDEANARNEQLAGNLIKRIQANRAAGKDTSRLVAALKDLSEREVISYQDILNTETGGSLDKNTKQVLGEAFGTGIEALGTGMLANKVGGVLKAPTSVSQFKQAVGTGAVFGGGQFGAIAAQEDKSGKDILKETAKGAAIGGAFGGALGGAAKLASKKQGGFLSKVTIEEPKVKPQPKPEPKIDDVLENSLQRDATGAREKSLKYFRDNPNKIKEGEVRVREIEDGRLVIEDGRHRLQVGKEMGVNPKVVDVTAEYTGQPSKKVADLIRRQESFTPKTSQDISAVAIERKLIDENFDSPEVARMDMRKQAEEALDLIDKDKTKAIDISLGAATPDGDLRAGSVFTALREKAFKEGDVSTLRQLSRSKVASEAAQELKAFDTVSPDDPVKILRGVQKYRENRLVSMNKNRNLKKDTQKVVQEIKDNIEPVKRESWEEFIENLKCNY